MKSASMNATGRQRRPRGEYGELSTSIAALVKVSATKTQLRDAMNKVLKTMNMGIDLSGLWPQLSQMVAMHKHDMVLKKGLYAFVLHYSQSRPDAAMMMINLVQQDCKDQDPSIRGVALRCLCSLRVPNLIEYMAAPVRKGLVDPHFYVRMTAVMGVLKMYHIDENQTGGEGGLMEAVRHMMSADPHPEVVANCFFVCLQVDGPGHILQSREALFGVLKHMKDFNEWAQCIVLEATAHYRPQDEDEVFEIMNYLEDRFTHTNSGIILATIKVFLNMILQGLGSDSANQEVTYQEVLERILDPLRSLLARDHPDIVCSVLHHAALLARRTPFVFANEYTTFFWRINDPTYVKKLKLEVLTTIAEPDNAYHIVSELCEYTRDLNPTMAQAAVRAIGQIALAVPDAEATIPQFLHFLGSSDEVLVAETLVQVVDIMRKCPERIDECLERIESLQLPGELEPRAKIAYAWILGTFGQAIPNAPYVLEDIAAEFEAEEVEVRQALLTAVLKLFMERPAECQPILGPLLVKGIRDPHPDVVDRSLFFCRALRADVEMTKTTLSSQVPVVGAFQDRMSEELMEQVFAEFNTLSVIYREPAAAFAPDDADLFADPDHAPPQEEEGDDGGEQDSLLGGTLLELDVAPADAAGNGAAVPGGTAPAAPSSMPTHPMDDLLGGFAPQAPHPPAAAAAPPPPVVLDAEAAMTPEEFQHCWASLPFAQEQQVPAPPGVAAALQLKPDDLCNHMKLVNLKSMAHGAAPGGIVKYFFYGAAATAATAPGSRVFVYAEVNVAGSSVQVQVKAEDAALAQPVAGLWTTHFQTLKRPLNGQGVQDRNHACTRGGSATAAAQIAAPLTE